MSGRKFQWLDEALSPEHLDRDDAVETATSLALELEPEPPPPSLRARLLDSIDRVNRFEDHIEHLADLYRIPRGTADALLRRIDEPEAWRDGPIPGARCIPVSPGPAYEGWTTAIVRLKAGASFPWHEHIGPETALILQGSCYEPDGSVNRPGQLVEFSPGTAHDFTTLEEGPDFIFAVRIGPGGVDFSGSRPG